MLYFLVYPFCSGLLFSDVSSSFPLPTCRIEAFNSLFGQHMRANRLDLISIADIENAVNSVSVVRYSRTEIISLLEVQYFNIIIRMKL